MCWENHRLDTAFWSHRLVTRLSGKTDGLIAPRDPPTNGTHTTSTRSAGSVILLKMLLCTQLAPARHVAQVGEKIWRASHFPDCGSFRILDRKGRVNCQESTRLIRRSSGMRPPGWWSSRHVLSLMWPGNSESARRRSVTG